MNRSRRSVRGERANAVRLTYRVASSADLATLVAHRHRMWAAIGRGTEPEIREHDPRYRRWLLRQFRAGTVVGVLAESSDGTAAGSGVVWFRPDQPRPRVRTETAPYILSMYTRPEWRGKGIASGIVRRLVSACRQRGYGYVILHASPQGRSVYRRLGFERTWEMRYFIDPKLRRNAARRATRSRRRKGKRLDRAR